MPPWTRTDRDFYQQCTRCGECITACPEQIIRANKDGYPQVDFSSGGCDFCAECVKACQHDVFQTDLTSKPWQQVAQINQECLAYVGVACQSCRDSCDVAAIRFKYAIGHAARPVLNREICTGCGMCVSVCPVQAIQIRHESLTPTKAQAHAS